MDLPTLPEPDLLFGGVHVDVHQQGWQIQIEHIGRVTAVMEYVLKGLAHGVGHQLVPHQAAVDIEELQIRLAAGEGGGRHPAPEGQTHGRLRHPQGMVQKSFSCQLRQAVPHPPFSGCGRQVEEEPTVVTDQKAGLGPGQGDAPDQLLDMAQLRLLRAQEFAPRRGVVEEIADLDAGAFGMGDGFRLVEAVSAIAADEPGLILAPGPGADLQTSDRGDARQGLATKAQGGHRFQVRQAGDLAGGMATQGQDQVLPEDTGAIVPDPQELDTTLLQLDLDAVRPRVQAVLDQFLDHGGGTLHHFARGDLVDQLSRQGADAPGLIPGFVMGFVTGLMRELMPGLMWECR